MGLDLIPNDAEHGYHSGWKAFHDGLAVNSNPYDPDDEQELYEGFNDGWGSAATVASTVEEIS